MAPPDWLVGLDGGRVRALEADDLLGWVSDVAWTSLEANIDRLKAHDAVCATALESGDTPLPVRFGQIFADDAAAAAGIAARAGELRTRIARIAGCVEIRVVITRGNAAEPAGSGSAEDEPAAGAPQPLEGPGTAFLRRLARAGRAEMAREIGCEDARHAIRAAARSLIVDQHRCETARGLAYFPVLVRRDDVDAFREAVTQAVPSNPLPSQAIGVSVLGPFAPYSFAGDA